jgi:hypothetical protein
MVEYGYKPVLGDVPEFNLPSVLPDLTMVADINWNSANLPEFAPIAPSTKNVMVDLPDVTPGTSRLLACLLVGDLGPPAHVSFPFITRHGHGWCGA